jgi:hypothetical protein
MTRTNKVLSIPLSLLILSGCTYRIADLTLVSTKNIDLTNVKLDARKGIRKKGEDCRISILTIPLGLPNLETAVDNALIAGGGNVLVDEVTELKNTWFLIGSQHCIVVEGSVLNISDAAHQKTEKK